MLRQSLNVPVPGIGTHCDIHARYLTDTSDPTMPDYLRPLLYDTPQIAWLGVYDRDRQCWHTTAGEGPGACYALRNAAFVSALAVLDARVRS